jgi:hypothetical protein
MFPARPAKAQRPTGPPRAGGMKITGVWEEGDVGFMTWEAGPVKTTEQFLVRNGKIELQAIFRSSVPAGAPPAG